MIETYSSSDWRYDGSVNEATPLYYPQTTHFLRWGTNSFDSTTLASISSQKAEEIWTTEEEAYVWHPIIMSTFPSKNTNLNLRIISTVSNQCLTRGLIRKASKQIWPKTLKGTTYRLMTWLQAAVTSQRFHVFQKCTLTLNNTGFMKQNKCCGISKLIICYPMSPLHSPKDNRVSTSKCCLSHFGNNGMSQLRKPHL